MIGDIVRVNKDVSVPKDTIVEIRGIDADNAFLKRNLKGSVDCVPYGGFDITYGVWVEYLDPIPLSAEFFEKNGWYHVDTDNDTKRFYTCDENFEMTAHEFNDGKWHIEYDCIEMGCIPIQCVNIGWVYELQHFFKQCGVERKLKI